MKCVGRLCLLFALALCVRGLCAQEARFNLNNINIYQAAAVLQNFTGQAVVLAPGVIGKISLQSEIPLDKARAVAFFDRALRAQNLRLRTIEGEIHIVRANVPLAENSGAPETRIFTLKNNGVAEVSPAVRAMLSPYGEISARDRQTLIVSDMPSVLVKVTRAILTADATNASPYPRLRLKLLCLRAVHVENLLQRFEQEGVQRYFVDAPTNTLFWQASDEQTGNQLLELVQTMDREAGCTHVSRSTTASNDQEIFAPILSAPPKEPEPIADQSTLSPADASRRELRQALDVWRAAWAARDVVTYLNCYAPHFSPLNGGGRNAWERKRKALLGRPDQISVDAADVTVGLQGATLATVGFKQTFRSTRHRDVVFKTMQWERVGGRWLIIRESSVSLNTIID